MGTTDAMGTAVLLYLVLSGRLSVDDREEKRLLKEASAMREREKKEKTEKKKLEKKMKEKGKDQNVPGKWPVTAPETFREVVGVAAKTVKYTWKETLGKWTLGEMAFGIKYCMKQEGNLQLEYTEGNSVQLKGYEVKKDLTSLLRYLKLCMYFSKKSYKSFSTLGQYSQENVLVKKSKGKLLKPAFTVVRDPETKSILLLIRGAISIKERLTAAAGLQVPFHHVVIKDGVVTDLVLGHAHCGMVVSARWIAKRVKPVLKQALQDFPDYNIKIIGHSMGACVGVILTYILRENVEFSSTTCLAYGPAACMTWELAECGKDFITTLVNRTDMVPSFCQVSTAHLRNEVSTSSWLNDLRDQIKKTRVLNQVNRSVAFLRSHVPFVSNPRSKVVDIDMVANSSAASTNDSKEVQSSNNPNKKHPHFNCFSCHISTPISTNSPKNVPQNIPSPIEASIIAESTASSSKLESDSEVLTDENLNLPTEGVQFFPPGRIMHMVIFQEGEEELVNIYETPREMYSKIRLARSIIRDHYMPRYIETLQSLVDKFENEGKLDGCVLPEIS